MTVESLRYLTIPRDRVTFTGVSLGNGAYGKVSEVEYDGTLCAAKEIHSLLLELADAREAVTIRDNFLHECYLWSTLRHPNIVSFLGIHYPSSDESGLPIMVMEKMQESVTSLVDKHDNIPLLVKLSILHDVSLGLRYLHAHSPPVVHRDLSSNNILLGTHLEAKVTDLGVAKAIMDQNSKTLTKTPGTVVFMPPEALDIKPLYGPPLDIFSFGGVVLHITSQQWPIPKSWSQIDPITRKRKSLSEVERRQQYIDMMTGGDADLKPLVLSCLEDDPELRPSAIDISQRMKRMVEECRKENTFDGIDPISWLAVQVSSARHLQQQSTTPDLFAGPVTIAWKEGPPAPSSRLMHNAVMFNGSIYVGGGFTVCNGKEQAIYCVDIYYSDTNKWDTIDTPHQLISLVVLMNKLLIVGGLDRNDRCTKKVLALESGEWIDYTEMPSARSYVGAVSHHSMMIVVGGYHDEALAVVELFDGSTGEWFICDDLPRPLEYPQAVVLGNMIYVLDKLENKINASSLHSLFDHNLQWHCLQVDMPHNSSTAVVLNNKYLLVLGGLLLNNGRSSDEIVTLNSISTEWISSAKIPEALSFTAVVCDDSHRLVVIGGCEEGPLVGTSRVWLGSFEL